MFAFWAGSSPGVVDSWGGPALRGRIGGDGKGCGGSPHRSALSHRLPDPMAFGGKTGLHRLWILKGVMNTLVHNFIWCSKTFGNTFAAAPWYEYGDPVGTSPPIFYFYSYPSSRYEGALCHPLGLAHNLRIFCPDRPEPTSPQTAQHRHSPLPCQHPLPHNPPLDPPVPDLERQSRWSLLVTPLPAGRASPQPDVLAAQSSLPSTRSKYGKTGMSHDEDRRQRGHHRETRTHLRVLSSGNLIVDAAKESFLENIEFEGRELAIWHGRLDVNCPISMVEKATTLLKGFKTMFLDEEAHSLVAQQTEAIVKTLMRKLERCHCFGDFSKVSLPTMKSFSSIAAEEDTKRSRLPWFRSLLEGFVLRMHTFMLTWKTLFAVDSGADLANDKVASDASVP
ncbi:hypothetical protein V8E51_016759 [Hyaloscypha variabilis]